MNNVPRFLKRPFRNAFRVALEEVTVQECRQGRDGSCSSFTASQEVG